MRRLAFSFGVAALLLAAPAATEDPGAVVSDRVDLGAAPETIDAQRELWQQRFREARAELDQAQQRRRRARDAYTHMRHRDRERGSEKVEVMQELTASEAAATRAEAALQQLSDSARKAGVPPGWLRALQSPASPSGSRGSSY